MGGPAMSLHKGLTRIEVARRLRGLSQQELAELAGLSTPTVRRLEHGKTTRAYAVLRIAAALERPVEDLFDGEGRPRPMTVRP